MDAVENVKHWQKEMANYQSKTSLSVFGVSAKSGLNVLVVLLGSIRPVDRHSLRQSQKKRRPETQERFSR